MNINRSKQFNITVILSILHHINGVVESQNPKERYIKNMVINFLDSFSDNRDDITASRHTVQEQKSDIDDVIGLISVHLGIEQSDNSTVMFLSVISDIIYLFHRKIISVRELQLIYR